MQTKRTVFPNKVLPYLLIAPQLLITVVFFLWPAATAFWQSFLRQDAFGFKTNFVWFQNYRRFSPIRSIWTPLATPWSLLSR